MSLVTRIRRDGCNREVPCDHPSRGYWWTVDRNHPRDFVEAGCSDRFDFCSLPCLVSWAQAHELDAHPWTLAGSAA